MALRRLRILLSQECNIPLNEAVEILRANRVKVNDVTARTTTLVAETDVVTLDDTVVANRMQYAYVLFNKPRAAQ